MRHKLASGLLIASVFAWGHLVWRASRQRTNDCPDLECLTARILEGLPGIAEEGWRSVLSDFPSVVCRLGNRRDAGGLEVRAASTKVARTFGVNCRCRYYLF